MSLWSEDDNVKLLELFNLGQSAAQIGKTLGRTRGSILGRLFRLGHCNSRVQPSHRGEVNAAACSSWSLPTVVEQAADREARVSSIPDSPRLPPILFPSKIDAFMATGRGRCKWPVGDPKSASFSYCLEPCDILKPYCRAHERKAHKQ